MTAKRLVLKLDDTPPEIEKWVVLIASGMRGYRMAYFLNKYLEVSLGFCFSLSYKPAKSSAPVDYPAFSWEDREMGVRYYLIENKNPAGALLKKSGNIDFLWIAKGNHDLLDKTQMVNQIRNIPGVVFVQPAPSDDASNMEHILESLEIKMIEFNKQEKERPDEYPRFKR